MKHIFKITVLTFILISNIGFAQNNLTSLKFDTKYFDAVDKWVAFPKKDIDSTYSYGFIYLDNQAGFTFNYETKFIIEKEQLKNIQKDSSSSIGFMKYRLEPKTSLVSVLSKVQISDLGLPEAPDWLSIYKEKANEVGYNKNEGYHFNHVGASNLALTPLLKAYEIEPHFDGLEFELSFAYNALNQFENAILVLEKAIEHNSKNFYFYRELGYSYLNLNKVKEAEEIYRKGISASDNDFEKSEMAVNMAQSYFTSRDKKKFDEWAKLTRKYAEKGSRYIQFIDHFEANWDKE